MLIELERISEADRRELAEIVAVFEGDRPAILGGVLDTLSKAMGIHSHVNLDRLPRMADFVRWGYAIGEALGGKGQDFLLQYADNRAVQNMEAINADPMAMLVVKLMSERDLWEGTANKLLDALKHMAPLEGISTYDKSFPSDGKVLARIQGFQPAEAFALFETARAHRAAAVDYVQQRQGGSTVHAIEREVSLLEALAAGMAWRAEEADVLGKVRLSGRSILMTWTGGDLTQWMLQVRDWIMKQLEHIEECDYWALSAEEQPRLQARFALYYEILQDLALTDIREADL